MAVELAPGLIHHPGWLDRAGRRRLADEIAAVLALAPPFTPRMPKTGKPFSVRMSNAGPLGWVSDIAGYRYQPDHPETGAPWPAMPATVRAAWDALAAGFPAPEACLINLYAPGTRMGLHQDRDEADLSAPVVSLSLGAAAVFRYGGLRRSDPTRSIRLIAGDALVIGGASRLIHHGVDRIIAGGDLLSEAEDPLPDFLPPGGRCNLTLRRVTGSAP
ncbi:alpha-ketoglutarate-dependent dioxygenase AlkB [Methylobacterium sp. WL103]|uniref:alpha-ketoglutarate-dependent dioxygenase AlkB n=1 Tax=unclassified Methylobacterium TaxID=2615210 RepID=UPI0011C7A542|nr:MULTISPECIES: alpha-ketoglutarate-dependent dioxygenase AlkB [unclassified Methylobacterium]TXM75195.1 alpha-ketoglutarate-dependent dioxygenase AlkB [Methylobacterium sp. WL12]TXM94006.1 alpha-ketoglutarate-dependent dioxygenase AlkB [Methylobacterium sp. WL103]